MLKEFNDYLTDQIGQPYVWGGQHIPFESFVTAARYPNSIMGEKVNQNSQSDL